MEKIIAIVAVFVFSAFAANVTFKADFEDSLEAAVRGVKTSPRAKDTVGMFDKGISGRAVKIGPWKKMQAPGTGEIADRNFGYDYFGKMASTSRGALSFWVKPVDWDGSMGTNHRMFVDILTGDGSCQFFIYKVLTEPSLYVHCKSRDKTNGRRIGSLVKWKKGEWHHVAFSWDNGAFTAFVDGEVSGNGSYTPMTGDFTALRVGSIDWAYEEGGSLLDELRVFDAPLTIDEVKGIINNSVKPDDVPGMIGVAKSMPKVDAVVAAGEYGFSGMGFMKISGTGFYEKQSRYCLGHDGKNLHLAVVTPLGEKAKYVVGRARDGELWEDENVEWHLYVPGKGQFQFIVNPEGAVYDSFDRKAEWNSNSFISRNAVRNGIWTFECSVSLEELGCADGNLSMNVARSFRDPDVNTCIAPVKRTMGFADKSTFLGVKLFDKQLPPVVMDDFQVAPNKLKMDVNCQEPLDCSVACSRGLLSLYNKKATGTVFNAETAQFIGGANIVVRIARGDDIFYQNGFTLANDSDKPLVLNYIYTELDSEEIVLKCSSFFPDDARGTIRLVISDLKGNKVAEKDYPFKGRGMSFDLTFPGATLPPGYYAMKGTHLAPDGSKQLVIDEDWFRPEKHEIPDYLSTDFIKVQPPWTPLVQNGNSIDALVKSYEFNDDFLLAKATANRTRLLASPMRLEVNGNSSGKATPPVFDNHGDFCFVTQNADYNGIRVTTKSRMDYDGLLKVVMTISPPEGGCTLSSMKMAIPFDALNMRYINSNGFYGKGDGLSGPLHRGVWTSNLFSQFSFWIGNDSSGFCWCAANMKGWHCKDNNKSLVINNEGPLCTAYLNFVDTPFELDRPRTIEFGIMASPGRPESQKVKRKLQMDWNMWWMVCDKYFDYIDPNFFKPRPAGKNTFLYNCMGVSAHCPHWNYYHKEWNREGIGRFSEDLPVHSQEERNRGHYVYSCMAPPSFMEYRIKQISYAIDNSVMDVHNLYFDLVFCPPCQSEEHGCAWTDDFGRKWSGNDWESRRAFFQIIRRKLLAKDPEGLISFHSHRQRLPMITSFCDIQVGGEDFVPQVGENGNYYGIVDTDVLRSYSVSFGLGPKCVFIPQFQRALLFTSPGAHFDEKLPKNQKAVRHLLVMLAIHDIDYWMSSPEANALSKYKKSFGWDENVFMEPFWNPEGYFTLLKDTTNGRFYVTVFRRDGRFILMALNDSPNEAEAVIQLDMNRLLGKQPSAIKDFYQPERRHTIDADKITLKLKDREPAILWFE